MERPAQYHTKQREAVLEYIRSQGGEHVTASQIALHFTHEAIPVGRTTVYRHLDKLTASGQLRRYTLDGKAGFCYQYAQAPDACREHFHLKCENCGELLHLQCDTLSETQRHIYETHTFQINTAKTVFYGTCDQCMREGG